MIKMISKVIVVLVFGLCLLTNFAQCEESELFEDLEGREPALSEKLYQTARTQWDQLMSANLNGYYSTLVYFTDQSNLNFPLGFNTTKPTTFAILGHFALILSGIYLLSLLPPGALNGFIPQIPFLNKIKGRRHRRRHRNRHRKQPYYDYYDEYNDYEDDYEYGFRHGPPRDHHRRLLRHGPPLFNKRMSDAKYHQEKETESKTTFENMNSMESRGVSGFMNEGNNIHKNIVKRQASSPNPWYIDLMNFAVGPFQRFSRSYSQLYDHYGDFWRFRMSNLLGTEDRKDSKSFLRIPQPPNFVSNVKSINRNIKSANNKVESFLSRLVTGVQRVAGVPLETQRRSLNPAQRRHSRGNRRQQRRNGRKRSHPRHEEPGPPPAVPEQDVEVVHALHEEGADHL